MILDIFFPVKPEPKLRARVLSTHCYTPAKTLHAETELRILAHGLLPKDFEIFDCPLRVTMEFYLERTRHVPKAREFPIVRPDLDNYIKLVSDALNGIVWKDDCLIVSIAARKRYAAPESSNSLNSKQGVRLVVTKEEGQAIE